MSASRSASGNPLMIAVGAIIAIGLLMIAMAVRVSEWSAREMQPAPSPALPSPTQVADELRKVGLYQLTDMNAAHTDVWIGPPNLPAGLGKGCWGTYTEPTIVVDEIHYSAIAIRPSLGDPLIPTFGVAFPTSVWASLAWSDRILFVPKQPSLTWQRDTRVFRFESIDNRLTLFESVDCR